MAKTLINLLIPKPRQRASKLQKLSGLKSKESIQHNFLPFFFFWKVIFTLLEPFPIGNSDPDPGTLLNPNSIRIRIRNTAF
jgi:hypothetical protein